MKRIITRPQKSDMGSGFGMYEFEEGTTLKEFLTHFEKNSNEWGTITIKMPDGEVLRKFDYNLFHDNKFYYNIEGWCINYKLKKVIFQFCFMNEDIEVYLKK